MAREEAVLPAVPLSGSAVVFPHRKCGCAEQDNMISVTINERFTVVGEA